jgi:hypothetical protein
MNFLLAWLAACNGCQPQLPSGDEDGRIDTSPPPDTGDTAVEDTGPPPMCELEEVEPNNSVEQVQALPMEVWACGHFDVAFDTEFFEFETIEPGWVEVTVEAAARGSSADAQVDVINTGTGDSVHVSGSYLSTDPRVVFPLDAPATFQAAVGESQYLSGEDYRWYLMASMVKRPVEWTVTETEANDSWDTANVFTMGDTVFGRLSAPDDFDWYKITTDEVPQTVTFNVVAYQQGSPANIILKLYRSDGTTLIRADRAGEIDYDPDPWFTQRSTDATEWYLLVRTEDDLGSPYHWYTLTISTTPIGL